MLGIEFQIIFRIQGNQYIKLHTIVLTKKMRIGGESRVTELSTSIFQFLFHCPFTSSALFSGLAWKSCANSMAGWMYFTSVCFPGVHISVSFTQSLVSADWSTFGEN